MDAPPKSSDAEYVERIESERREKDHFFRDHPQSPIPLALREAFTGLAYLPVNPKYRLRVKLERYANPQPVVLATSKGTPRDMVRFGHFEFTVGDQARRLQVYKAVQKPGEHQDESLFIPFRDATSGKESYPAGRYIDLPVSKTDEYVLDFNLAYNPYCAYNDAYVCPLPPRDNWLDIRIEAGEKDFPLDDLKEKTTKGGKPLGHRHH